MGNKLTVLNNVVNGLFLTQHPENYDEDTNAPIPAYDNILVLNEFKDSTFARLNDEVQRAETQSFFFYKYKEDEDEDVVWIDVKGAEGKME